MSQGESLGSLIIKEIINMKIFTDEFKESFITFAAKFVASMLVIVPLVLIFGIVGYLETH